MRTALIMIPMIVLAATYCQAAGTYPYADNKDVVGATVLMSMPSQQTFHQVARRYNIGYNEITGANPGEDPWLPEAGSTVIIPTKWVLPNTERKGIVINLAEMRMYRYIELNGCRRVTTFPIGVGMEGYSTPLGTLKIREKLRSPKWRVPYSLRQELPHLPAVVEPGDDNPLGDYALRLSNPEYLIHGTNHPFGIGKRVSHGCIRMYPEDIRSLFETVDEGTLVNIVYQPVKVGVSGGDVYVEVHEDYLGRIKDLRKHAIRKIKRLGYSSRVDLGKLDAALAEHSGMPVSITKEAGGKATPPVLTSTEQKTPAM